MKHKLKIAGIIGVLATVAQAGEAMADRNLKKILDEQGIYVEASKPGVKLSGYVDAGYTYNFVGGRTQVPMRGANDGGQANVVTLLDRGTGPHDFQFKLSNMKKLVNAQLLIANGLGIES